MWSCSTAGGILLWKNRLYTEHIALREIGSFTFIGFWLRTRLKTESSRYWVEKRELFEQYVEAADNAPVPPFSGWELENVLDLGHIDNSLQIGESNDQ